MAKMIPSQLNDEDFLNSCEREVFEVFKEGLSDDWTVIYSLKWAVDDDIYLEKSNGECDFILINHNYGIMILEVKGGIISCINGQWSSVSRNNIRIDIQDPQKQADISKFNLLSKFKSVNVNPYITTTICFPDCLVDRCSLPPNISKKIVIDMTSFSNIEEKVIEIFKHKASKESFTINKLIDSDYKKVLDVLNPKVKSKMPLLKLTSKLNMKFIKLNDEQKQFFEQLHDNKLIAVRGHAGTGKTILALNKAYRESNEGYNVAFICYNNLLREKIEEESDGKFKVFSMHSLASEYLKIYNEEAYKNFEETGDFDIMMTSFMEEIKNNKVKNKMLFDSIIIDEGQDFIKEWYESINMMLKDEGRLCIFYDEYQMLYKKYGRDDISFLNNGTRYCLTRNMRNTDEICLSSLNMIDINKDEIMLRGISGVEPEIIFVEDSLSTISALKNVIKELKKNEYLGDDNIAVLTIEAKKKLRFKKGIASEFSGYVESIRRFKGLESDVVIIPDLESDFIENEDIKNLLYVGMSRAKTHLILIVNTESFNRKQRSDYKKHIKEKLFK